MKRLLFFLLACAAGLLAQSGAPVRVTEDPPPDAVSFIYVINGSSQITAICSARSTVTSGARASTNISISAISKANPAVVTSTAHGLDPSLTMNSTTATTRPLVTISGATGTGWSAVNATFTATVIDADTFSIPVNSSAFGTLGGTVTFTTTAPRVSAYEWSVQKLAYDASGNVFFKGWLGGTSAYVNRCSDASSTTLQQQ